MNPFEKIYCRVFQAAFHLALPLLPYREPQLISGICQLGPVLKEKNLRTVLLVTDPLLKSSGATKPLEDVLARNGTRCVIYDQTRANPTVHNVEEALALYNENHCDGLIAFGGGSSMDCAKAVGGRVAYPLYPVPKLMNARELEIFYYQAADWS